MRLADHLQLHMPGLGLRFGKFDLAPASPGGHAINVHEIRRRGWGFVDDGNFEVLRAPVGIVQWSCQYTLRRVGDTLDLYHALARLPGTHAAFSLARYQLGRLSYMTRTTPRALCAPAMRAADACLRVLVQGWMGGVPLTDDAWVQVTLSPAARRDGAPHVHTYC